MRFRIANISSFQRSPMYYQRKMRYHDTTMIEADLTIDGGIRSLHMICEPSQAWNEHVIPLVLDKFSVGRGNTSIDSSMFATIPRLVSSTQEGSPVYAVCNAVACAYMASTTRTTAALAHRTRAYGSALRAVNVALADPLQCKDDSTLLAIWMFVVYEVRAVYPWRTMG